jgi:hypothetical protein
MIQDLNESDDAVEECVAEFAKIDRNSFTFRYPTDRNGAPIAATIERLDLIELCNDVMDAIEGYFSGAYDYLNDLKKAPS